MSYCTGEEAIRTLDSMLIGNESLEVFGAINMAIDAIKKNKIGVEPKYELEACGRNFELEWVAHCPTCGKKYLKYRTHNGFCVDCGQRIKGTDGDCKQ